MDYMDDGQEKTYQSIYQYTSQKDFSIFILKDNNDHRQ